MYLNLQKIQEIHGVLSKFTEQKLPIRLSYKLMKIISSLENEITFYRDEFQNLLEEYALKDENGAIVYTDDGENIKLIPEKSNEFQDRYFELNELDVELPFFSFTLEELENLELTPKELYIIEEYIEDPEEVEPDEDKDEE